MSAATVSPVLLLMIGIPALLSYGQGMNGMAGIGLILIVLELACAGADLQGADAAEESTKDFARIRSEVEMVRGKKFKAEVPVARISEAELRAISDRELDKDYPGQKLGYYEELLAWLDIFPPHTSLKEVEGKYLVDQVAGLYDSDAKRMCIPAFNAGTPNVAKKATEKKLSEVSSKIDEIVLAHEFTHALEDQHWPFEDAKERAHDESTDRETAKSFMLEGSATRAMLEVIPAQWARGSPGGYFVLWNVLHSGLGEFVLNYALNDAWKSEDALVDGVPPSLARLQAMPYSFGYSFCTDIMRKWGLDGLDYIYDHPPISSEQVIHPSKSWEWRDFPVEIALPETLPGDWKRVSQDSVGQAGMAVLFGCQSSNLNHGLQLAEGWDGDQAGLFARTNGQRLLLWASAWDSTNAAGRYANALLKARHLAHEAEATNSCGNCVQWIRPDGRAGGIVRQRQRVILIETDDRRALENLNGIVQAVTFSESRDEAARAAKNDPWLRFNPFIAWQKDDDYSITRSLGGLLSRHDRNRIGAADSFLLGLVGESRRTTSFHKWELGGGMLARHESETRRGYAKTTILPWGVLASHASAPIGQASEQITRTSVVWGLGASLESTGTRERECRVLPFGMLFHSKSAPGRSAVHILATGFSRKRSKNHAGSTTRFHLLGFPIWTSHSGPAQKTGSDSYAAGFEQGAGRQ